MLKWRINSCNNLAWDEFTQNYLRNLDLDTISSQMLDAVFFGFSIMEITWQYKKGQWTPASPEEKPQEWFYFNDDNQLIYRGKTFQHDLELHENKFLLIQHQATYANPYGEKILSRCYWPVSFKRNGFESWVSFTEKYGMPFLIAKMPRTAGREETDVLCSPPSTR